jgi:hypothetical protein
MHYFPAYLRPLSQIHTGNESGLDKKAEKVEQIDTRSDLFRFTQQETVPLRTYKEAL